MASGSNPQPTQQQVHDDDRVDQSAPRIGTPARIRLANIPEQAIVRASKYLRRNILPDDDDDEILQNLYQIRAIVKQALEEDPELKDHLASEEEYRGNVTKKGEKMFIDSLRTMAANSVTQGIKAWKGLLTDGTSSSLLGPSILIVFSV